MLSEKLRNGIRTAMEEYGAIGTGWRLDFRAVVVGTERGSDWARVSVDVTPPRRRKPTNKWVLEIHTVFNRLHWDISRVYYYPAEKKRMEKRLGHEVLGVESAEM